MLRPSTFVLASGAVLGVASLVVYFALDDALLGGGLMFVAVSDGVIGVFLRNRLGR